MWFVLWPLMVLRAEGPSLPANGDFDDGLAGWRGSATNVMTEAAAYGDRSVAHMTVPNDVPVGWPSLYQDVKAVAGDLFEAHVDASGRNVCDGYGVYMAMEFHDAAGKRLSFSQSPAVGKDGEWRTFQVRSVVPPGGVTVRLCLILNGHGEAFFDHARLVRLGNVAAGALDGPVTLTVTEEVACPSLIGFGAEDDGWFYNPENAKHGVTEEDTEIREGRIEWMDPDWVRMFFWYKDWNPSEDWETFTFDTPNMESHYRTLEVYQRIGAIVNVTGVEWGMADPYGQPEKVAKAVGALFEHLIRAKGYTCVQQWTLTNEPNGAFAAQMGYTFDRYVALHVLIKQEFARRNLAVQSVGSDDTGGLPWFTDCVRNPTYFDSTDLFVSHNYMPYADRLLAPLFFEDRLKLLAEKTPRKPFAVAEFGFQDSRSGTLENPIMETYPYAVWTAAFVIEGLNHGVAGFSIWCLSEVFYPGNGFMNYGLWDYKDNGWKLRPVYHAMANFTRLTERGNVVRRCDSTHPYHVLGTMVGKTLFWVNRCDDPAEVRVTGFEVREVRIMTEFTLEGDRICGVLVNPSGNRFTAPPQSFGYATRK